MNRSEYIEEKKRQFLKTEACDWDCHNYCEKEVIVGSKTSPCLCDCHGVYVGTQFVRLE